jgi:ABC-type phosphonate transport system ATPase subunit
MAPLEAVGLKDFRDEYPQEPSGGMRQQVARSLVRDPATLPIDEPRVEAIAVAMPRPRHLEVIDGGAFGNHVCSTIDAFDAKAVAAAARSAGRREGGR